MKPTFITAVLVSALASTTAAAPVNEPRQLFGFPGAALGSAVDAGVGLFGAAACAFSTFVAGRSSLCFNRNRNGDGDGTGVTVSAEAAASGGKKAEMEINDDDNSYDFEYKTVGDQYEIKVTPKGRGREPCTEKYDKSEGDIQELVGKAAEKCLDQ